MTLVEHGEYALLGLMLSGGIAAAEAGGRMLQPILTRAYVGELPGVPNGVLLLLAGGISFGIAAGYLLRDVQSDRWGALE